MARPRGDVCVCDWTACGEICRAKGERSMRESTVASISGSSSNWTNTEMPRRCPMTHVWPLPISRLFSRLPKAAARSSRFPASVPHHDHSCQSIMMSSVECLNSFRPHNIFLILFAFLRLLLFVDTWTVSSCNLDLLTSTHQITVTRVYRVQELSIHGTRVILYSTLSGVSFAASFL